MTVIVKSAYRIVFLLGGLLMVLLSFVSANTVFSQGKSLQLTQKKMYVSNQVLPDHILYPVFMIADRAKLMLARPEDKAQLNINYSWERLTATEELLKKGYQGLSFSTLTKACKYQNSGLIEADSLTDHDSFVKQALEFKTKVNTFKSSFTDKQQQELDALLQEQTSLLANLN